MKKKGFTLIELLVVISIIALLSSIVLASLSTARAKARDARRMQDMHTIRTVLELYYSKNGSYPVVPICSGIDARRIAYSNDANGCWVTNADSLQSLLRDASPNFTLPTDLATPPNDTSGGPWNTNNFKYAYIVTPTGDKYDLVTQFEDRNNPNRCELKQFKYHAYGETNWCPPGAGGWASPYLFADH